MARKADVVGVAGGALALLAASQTVSHRLRNQSGGLISGGEGPAGLAFGPPATKPRPRRPSPPRASPDDRDGDR